MKYKNHEIKRTKETERYELNKKKRHYIEDKNYTHKYRFKEKIHQSGEIVHNVKINI